MSLYCFIDKYILLPLADKLMRRGISKEWRLLTKTDWISEQELIDLQSVRLRKLITHCYANVPYYTKLFDRLGLKPEDIQTHNDLQKLPILTKQIICDNYQDLISSDITQRHTLQASTGGSTGKPLRFLKDIKTWNAAWAVNFRAWNWYGVNLGDRFFTFGGNSLVKQSKVKKHISYKNLFDKLILNTIKEDCSDLSEEAMINHYNKMIKARPKFLRGYPSAINYLALFISKNHLSIPSLKAVITTGETLLPQYRHNIRNVFKAPVYDTYGAADGGIAAHECTKHEGLHISEERCVIEIVDKYGSVVDNGKTGFLVSTDLENYSMPFVRYLVGDMAYIKKEKCSCGRASRLIGEVLGRSGKVLTTKFGVPYTSVVVDNMMFLNMDYHTPLHQTIYNKMKRFQVRQDKNGDIEILIIPKDTNEPMTTFAYIKDNFCKNFPGSLVAIKFVSEIPTMPSGKEDYCVSEYEYEKL
jgi:phenylacetate-CoA ligase